MGSGLFDETENINEKRTFYLFQHIKCLQFTLIVKEVHPFLFPLSNIALLYAIDIAVSFFSFFFGFSFLLIALK